MAAVSDNFDSYTDGDLNGQGSWSGDTSFDIQGSVTQAGAKAVINNPISKSIAKGFTQSSTGIQSIYGRTSNTANAVWQIRLREGAGANIYVKTESGSLKYFNGAAYITIGAVSLDTWFKVDIQWDASTDQARYRLDDGTWTSYANFNGTITTGLDTLALHNDSGTNADAYWDTATDGAASSSSIKTINGLALASVKTVNGLAIASVKTINGLA